MSFSAGFRVGWDAVGEGLKERDKRKALKEIKGLDIAGMTPLEQAEAKAKIYEQYGLLDVARNSRMDAQTIATADLNRTLAQRQDTRAAETHAPTLEGLQLRNDANRQNYAFNEQANPLRVESLRQGNIGQEMSNVRAALDYDLASATFDDKVEAGRLGNLRTRADIGNTQLRNQGLSTENEARDLQLREAQRIAAEQAKMRNVLGRFSALPKEEQTPELLEASLSEAIGPVRAREESLKYGEDGVRQLIQRDQRINESLKLAEKKGTLAAYVQWWDGIDDGTFVSTKENPDGTLSVVVYDEQSGEPVAEVARGRSEAELLAQTKSAISNIGPFSLASEEMARANAAAKLAAEKTRAGIRRDNAAALKDENSLGAQRIKDEVGVVQEAMGFGDPKFAGQGLELVDEIYARNRGLAPQAQATAPAIPPEVKAAGGRYIGTSGGKPVYELPDGTRVIDDGR